MSKWQLEEVLYVFVTNIYRTCTIVKYLNINNDSFAFAFFSCNIGLNNDEIFKNFIRCTRHFTGLCRGNRLVFHLEKKVAKCPYSAQHNKAAQHHLPSKLAVEMQAISRGTGQKRAVPYQTELYCSVETRLNFSNRINPVKVKAV